MPRERLTVPIDPLHRGRMVAAIRKTVEIGTGNYLSHPR
jgi:hypothetical protein